IIATSCVIVLCAGLTVWRNVQWHDDLSLWQAAVAANDSSARAQCLYAEALLKDNKYNDAEAHAAKALQLDANYPHAAEVLGQIQLKGNKYKEALDNFQKAERAAARQGVTPTELAPIERDEAMAYMKLGAFEKAKQLAFVAAKTTPEDPELQLIIGEALVNAKLYTMALQHLEMGFTASGYKNTEFLVPMAKAMVDSGLPGQVEQAYLAAQRAMILVPGRDTAIVLTRAALSLQLYAEAQKGIEGFVNKNPNDAEAQYLLYLAFAGKGDKDYAQEHKELALKLNPNIASEVTVPKNVSPRHKDPTELNLMNQLRQQGAGLPQEQPATPAPVSNQTSAPTTTETAK
ncbi:MAG: tetratricopeptide repeat protein, partial [Terriglobales bacterium]